MTNFQQFTEPELHERRQALSVEALAGDRQALEAIDIIESELRRRQIVAEREALAETERARRAAIAREQERQRLIAALTQQLAALDAAAGQAAQEVARASAVFAGARGAFDLAGGRADVLRGKLHGLTQDPTLERPHYAPDDRVRVRQTLAGEAPTWLPDLEALRALTPAPEPVYDRR